MTDRKRAYEEHWDLILAGSIAVGLVGGLSYAGGGSPDLWHPWNVWLFLVVVFLSPAGGFAVGFLFLLFCVGFFFRARAETTSGQLWLSGALIGTVFTFSSAYYAMSWRYREVYTPTDLYNGWLLMSLAMAVATLLLFIRSVRLRSPQALIITHAMLFVWLFSYAFPWIGEKL